MTSPGGGGAGVGIKVNVYNAVNAKVGVAVSALTNTEQAAMYLHEDLLKLVTEAGIDLFAALDVPDDYGRDQEDLIAMICSDIEQMLRHRLIDGAEILLSDPNPGPNGAYMLRYRVSYEISTQPTLNPTATSQLGRWGGEIAGLRQAYPNARFAFGVRFRPNAFQNDIQRPLYLFDWLPEGVTYDGRDLVTFRFGGYNTTDIRVARIEYGNAQNVGNP